MTFARDIKIERVDMGIDLLEERNRANLEEQTDVLRALPFGKIVACPEYPVQIQGITAADAFDAGDAFGTITVVNVPKAGILYSATFWDLDDEKTQVDLEVFRGTITQIASDDAWELPVIDLTKFVTEIAFAGFDDHIHCATSEVNDIGKAYEAPGGMFYIQAVCRATPTIASNGVRPYFQLFIISFDPDWH